MKSKFIPLSVPNLKGNELEYLTQAIETEWVSSGGPYVSEFEEKLAEYVGVESAVSCQNGTSGLHTALMVSGIGSNDEVIVPDLTFIAAVNPVKYVGAYPIFMDCDESLTIDVNKLSDFCELECELESGVLKNKSSGRYIKAIVVVHVFGNMANMEAIMTIARKYNLLVIEDATEALGTFYTKGKYSDRHAGTIGDIGIYSFNGNKIMTTGGGGMIVSNHKDYLEYAKHLTTQAKSDGLFYLHDEVGYNYRMTNLQAAVGLAQLEMLENFIETKEKNYNKYKEYIADIEHLRLIPFREGTRPNYWFYSLYVDDNYMYDRDEVIYYLQENNVQTRPIWGLIHEQRPYRESQTYKIVEAPNYVRHIVNLPCSSNLTFDDIAFIIDLIR